MAIIQRKIIYCVEALDLNFATFLWMVFLLEAAAFSGNKAFSPLKLEWTNHFMGIKLAAFLKESSNKFLKNTYLEKYNS